MNEEVMNYLEKNPLARKFFEFLNQGKLIFAMKDSNNFYKTPEVKAGQDAAEAELIYEFDEAVKAIYTLDELVKKNVLVRSSSSAPSNYISCNVYAYSQSH